MFFPVWKADGLDPEETCGRIAGKLASASLEDCLADGVMCSGSYFVEGAPLLVKEFPSLERRDPQARILVVGGTHGDEVTIPDPSP